MPKKKTLDSPSKNGDEVSLQVLMKEYDALRDMYNQAERNLQTMFNYYLTLMTVVFGGATLVLQPNSGIRMIKTAEVLLLVFFALIGSLYISSLSTNFAHTQRYANGINALRRFIFERFDISLPPIYNKFMSKKYEEKQSKGMFILSLLIPVNTYQLFTVIINSLSWAVAISIIYYGNSGVAGYAVISRGLLTFVITYLIYSVYSRLIFQFTVSRLSISIGH